MAAYSPSSGAGGLPGHGPFSALPASSCQVGRAWGRREQSWVPLTAPWGRRPIRDASSAASLPPRPPACEALLCCPPRHRCPRAVLVSPCHPPQHAGSSRDVPRQYHAPEPACPCSFWLDFACPPEAGQLSQPPSTGTVQPQVQGAPCLHPSAQSLHQYFQEGLPLVPRTHRRLTSQTSTSTAYSLQIFHLRVFPHLLESLPTSCNAPLVLPSNFKLNLKLVQTQTPSFPPTHVFGRRLHQSFKTFNKKLLHQEKLQPLSSPVFIAGLKMPGTRLTLGALK